MALKLTRSFHRVLLYILFFLLTVVTSEEFGVLTETLNGRFSRDECLNRVEQMLENKTLSPNSSVFFRDRSGTIFSSPDRPVLTYPGCNRICGENFGWYKDIGPRLSTWLIPVFLLISNMEVSPLDKRRYLMIVHLMGDPIDSLFSMLTKLEAWSRCYHLAVGLHEIRHRRQIRQIATVLGGFEELVGFKEDPLQVYMEIRKKSRMRNAEFQHLVARTAQQLADSRTDERLRTIFATVLYCYQLVAAFVAIVGGGNTSPPGGRIGLTMWMTWIVPSILLSNAMGGFTSRRTCYDILEAFVSEATGTTSVWRTLQKAAPSLGDHKTVHDYMDSLAWSGAIYTYRPNKTIPFSAGPHDHKPRTLLLLAAAPVVTSSIISSVILWNTPPIGINCRNILIFCITTLVLLSALLTHLLSRMLSGPRHWYAMLIKDAFIAIPSITLVFLACAGRFNSCYCWSGVFSLRHLARVPLNAAPEFVKYNKMTYPILVAACLTLQIVAFVGMMAVGWRGWNVMRWSEEEKIEGWSMARQDWRGEMEGQPQREIRKTARRSVDKGDGKATIELREIVEDETRPGR